MQPFTYSRPFGSRYGADMERRSGLCTLRQAASASSPARRATRTGSRNEAAGECLLEDRRTIRIFF